jgi:drug/metabolite transporter, DME family
MQTTVRTRRLNLGYAAIAGAAACWAVAAIVARRLFDDGVSPLELSAARSVITGLGLAFLLRQDHVGRQRAPLITIIGLGLSIALVNASYYLAIERLSVAVAIVLQYMAPALVVTWIALRARRVPSRQVGLALFAAVVGVILVVELVGSDIGRLNAAGVGFGLGSAVLFATYTLLAEPVASAYGSLGAMARAFAVAGIFWILYLVATGWPDALFESGVFPRVLFVGLAGTLIPFSLYVWGIARVRAERATIAATLEPVFAAIAAWVWLNQTLSVTQLIGGALVLVAVATLQLSTSNSQ